MQFAKEKPLWMYQIDTDYHVIANTFAMHHSPMEILLDICRWDTCFIFVIIIASRIRREQMQGIAHWASMYDDIFIPLQNELGRNR